MRGEMEKLPKSPSKQTEDFIYLVACALENRIPNLQKVNQMNLEQMYRLSRRHSMSAMIYMVLAQSGIWNEKTNDGEKDFVEKWKEKKENIIRTTLLMDAESQALYQYMEENAIWYMPLKGAIMASFYPRYGMREMSDRDILYDATYQKQLCEWMKERGYSAKSVGVGNHDVYEKMPVYHFEMESQNAMQARLKYIWKNMFLTPEQRERINPFLRHKWSIPFWVLYRSGRAVLFKRSVIKTKLEILRKIK